jgi:pimeloyl-ACP methyl ester carboxylesterase
VTDAMTNLLEVADGRVIEVRVTGPEDGWPLVFHHGTPGSLPTQGFERAVHSRGLRLISFARPGYANSTRQPGRAVVDVVADTEAVLRSIGAGSYPALMLGWSGGGPHALACAARLPRVVRALTVAGLGPCDGDGLDFTAGMDDENRAEWAATLRGEAAMRELFEPLVEGMTTVMPDSFAFDPENALPPADRIAMTGEFAADLAASNRHSLEFGIDGLIDDELAFSKPWGFDLSEIRIPLAVFHGTADANVPVAHGHWLASQIPKATLHLEQGEGHLSIMANALEWMLDAL